MKYLYNKEFPFLNIKNLEIVEIYMAKEREEDSFLLESIYNGSALCIDFENIIHNFGMKFNIRVTDSVDVILKFYIEYIICQFLEIGYYELNEHIVNQEHLDELRTICYNNKVKKDFLLFEEQLNGKHINCLVLQFIKNEVCRKMNVFIGNSYLYAYCGYIAESHVSKGNSQVLFKNLTGNSI